MDQSFKNFSNGLILGTVTLHDCRLLNKELQKSWEKIFLIQEDSANKVYEVKLKQKRHHYKQSHKVKYKIDLGSLKS